MDFGFLIIIFVIIMVIVSAASKRKKPSKKDEDESEPVRRPTTTMSDIQRAFMMMTDPESEERQHPPKAERPVPKPVSPFRDFSNEGMRGATEGFMSDQGTRYDGVKPSLEGIRKDGITNSTEGFRDFSKSMASTEGTGYKTVAAMEARVKEESSAPMQHRLQDRITDSDKPDKVLLDPQQAKAPDIQLFRNQNDIVRAVIYSEILKRKTGRKA